MAAAILKKGGVCFTAFLRSGGALVARAASLGGGALVARTVRAWWQSFSFAIENRSAFPLSLSRFRLYLC